MDESPVLTKFQTVSIWSPSLFPSPWLATAIQKQWPYYFLLNRCLSAHFTHAEIASENSGTLSRYLTMLGLCPYASCSYSSGLFLRPMITNCSLRGNVPLKLLWIDLISAGASGFAWLSRCLSKCVENDWSTSYGYRSEKVQGSRAVSRWPSFD